MRGKIILRPSYMNVMPRENICVLTNENKYSRAQKEKPYTGGRRGSKAAGYAGLIPNRGKRSFSPIFRPHYSSPFGGAKVAPLRIRFSWALKSLPNRIGIGAKSANADSIGRQGSSPATGRAAISPG